MEQCVQWFFEVLGTEILSLIVGMISDGFIGFRVGKRTSKFKQSQKAGRNSKQYQSGEVSFKEDCSGENRDNLSSFRQSQIAGDNSEQVQNGGQGDV